MPDDAHGARFERTLKRLLPEMYNLLSSQAALEALLGTAAGPIVSTAFSALQSDRLLRLMRIFEDSRHTATFWYLLRCEPHVFDDDRLDIAFLRQFSKKLKMIRDKTFVHIDKDAVFDPQAIYQAAGLTGDEIVRALEMVWRALNRVYSQRSGKTHPMGDESLAGFREMFRRDWERWREN